MNNCRHVRGIIHVHTTHSHDGILSPEKIASLCKARGLNFAAITDHVEDMDENSMQRLVIECDKYSDGSILLIPGLEHRTSHGIHILALGQRKLVPRTSLTEFLALLAKEHGCVLIGAHNYSCDNLLGDSILQLHAMEIWNISRDTRYLPISAAFRAYKCSRSYKPDMMAVGGLDMHRGHEWGCQLRLYNCHSLTIEDVLSSVRRGDFLNRGKFVSFSSRPGLGAFRALVAKAGDTLIHIRKVRDLALAALDDNDYAEKNT